MDEVHESRIMALSTLVVGLIKRMETSGKMTNQEIIDLFDDSKFAIEQHFPLSQKKLAVSFLEQVELPFLG